MFNGLDYTSLYTYDEFFTDGMYDPDFGLYSSGRLLLGSNAEGSADEFQLFTTYPMMMAPHFGRLLCRTLLRMWLAMDRPPQFTVMEFGAGSGQLASDTQTCVSSNVLGLSTRIAEEWRAAFRSRNE